MARIFIGPVDIANVGAILASALRERGIKVTVVNFGISPSSAIIHFTSSPYAYLHPLFGFNQGKLKVWSSL